ncbi:TetR family transcriptional regulator [Rhizobium sp. Leaf306]|jgi:AcrR family transcriptional regulator|uniref:AcrR family transcriptional regulator n=2 Tax=Rhizobium/Agrobacterium group TaxID=227290 RepID=A0A7X0JIA8_9HYPH|nr:MULTISPECIES: TetR/AcrR family transcriptional regulator [unclassified Rhizobium]KQQ38141.1 TetR family transcriptional regulator [Rhizobium sp. Leaf306]MBB6507669.1 AcrR family transcriptional regulator [Rhizobium soli]RYE67684.1 MAG: TetR/AcrR family transcriptional regulator [Rhizobiaceae bacterium]SEH23546.1 transcriptional regulator, TetR family [Rhizobium sp. NFR12]
MRDSMQSAGGSSLRRVPKQERSRERIDDILKVSMELIGEKGIDAVTMKEIASLSGGPIASVYQYFPNKSAIIAMLHERYVEEVRGIIVGHIPQISTAEDALDATDVLFDLYYTRMREKPSTQDLLNAIQADKALADRDITETRFQADLFFEITKRFVSEQLWENYARTLFLMFHMAAATLRLALMVTEDEAAKIVAQFKSIVRAQSTYYFKGSFPASL